MFRIDWSVFGELLDHQKASSGLMIAERLNSFQTTIAHKINGENDGRPGGELTDIERQQLAYLMNMEISRIPTYLILQEFRPIQEQLKTVFSAIYLEIGPNSICEQNIMAVGYWTNRYNQRYGKQPDRMSFLTKKPDGSREYIYNFDDIPRGGEDIPDNEASALAHLVEAKKIFLSLTDPENPKAKAWNDAILEVQKRAMAGKYYDPDGKYDPLDINRPTIIFD
jgi:hypothetical protein